MLFQLRWRGWQREFTTDYVYDGCAPYQTGLTFEEWRQRCIDAVRREGFILVDEEPVI